MQAIDSTTIVALSTPRGYSGIAIIRLSGRQSKKIINKIFKTAGQISPRRATYGSVYDKDGFIDNAIVTYFPAPHSYTGEDVVEISTHGNPFICDLIIEAVKTHGAVDAAPGEFTKRAFLNNKLDLSQAEGVADIIYSSSRAALTASSDLLGGSFGKTVSKIKKSIVDILSVLELELDFSEEEINFSSEVDTAEKVSEIIKKVDSLLESYKIGKIIREGILCPIIGLPNCGKSTLFNSFLKEERVIVSPIPGTTRDYIEESLRVGNYLVRLIDTAGLRKTKNTVESIGIQKANKLIEKSNAILYVIDPTTNTDISSNIRQSFLKKTYFIINKSDIATDNQIKRAVRLAGKRPYFICSAITGSGVHEIAAALVKEIEMKSEKYDAVIITRRRHREALKNVRKCLLKARKNLLKSVAPEIVSIDLRDALSFLDVLLGKTENEDILNNIFNNFCIGK